MKKIIHTDGAPGAIGPYSQAVLAGDFLYISGQIGIDVKTNKLAGYTAVEQAIQILRNIGEILKEAGMQYKHVVKTTILLKDIKDFTSINEVYGQFFHSDYPARATYEISDLPLGASIEIEAVAYKS